MPFAGELLATGYMLAAAPMVWAGYFAMHDEWLLSAVMTVLWMVTFPLIAVSLHRQRLIHIGVSIFLVVAAIAALPLAAWAREMS